MYVMTVQENTYLTQMRRLKVDIFDERHEFVFRIICGHIEAHQEYTYLYDLSHISRNKYYLKTTKCAMYCLAFNVNHWVVEPDGVTIYYNTNYYIKVNRID